MGLFLCAKREPLGEKLRLRMGYDIPHPIPPVIGALPGNVAKCLFWCLCTNAVACIVSAFLVPTHGACSNPLQRSGRPKTCL